jgi:ABC-type amino acid transport substrate-binding protein
MNIRTILTNMLLCCLISSSQANESNSASIADDLNLRVGFLSGNPPWSYIEDGVLVGITIDEQQNLFNGLGFSMEKIIYENYPRMISELTKGNLDIVSGFSGDLVTSPQNGNILCAHEYFRKSAWGAFSLSSRNLKLPDSKEDIRHYRVGHTRLIQHISLPFINEKKLTITRTPEHLYRLLVSQRVDLVLTSKKQTEYWYAKYGTSTTEAINFGSYKVNVCISLVSQGREKGKIIIDKINQYLLTNRRQNE